MSGLFTLIVYKSRRMKRDRKTPIEISKEEFQKIGHQLVDQLAAFFDTIRERNVTPGETPRQLQQTIGKRSLPEEGTNAEELFSKTTELLFNHSLFNGHPKFMGYITSSPAPIGALADMLAASVNPNVGAQILSPIATEIEKQTVQWLAEFIGVSPTYGGILVSGGNMANFTAFLAARNAKAVVNIKEQGLAKARGQMLIYCSKTTHTWIEKAATLFGNGSISIRWIDTDSSRRMNNEQLEEMVQEDIAAGHQPFLVVGTAGDVSTGVVDDLAGIAIICKAYDLWFHIDGAYGIPAVVVPEVRSLFKGLEEADSIALDPHKWLYSPLEAGCTLVKDRKHLLDAFSSHPSYYNFTNNDDIPSQNFYEYGLQNSRGFRALKVWMSLQHVGSNDYAKMITEDVSLSKLMYKLAAEHPELEAVTQSLSITTLRYLPAEKDMASNEEYLHKLNEAILNELQKDGEVFLSNALVNDKYCLRGCIVNFRTSEQDIHEIINIITKKGKQVHQRLARTYLTTDPTIKT